MSNAIDVLSRWMQAVNHADVETLLGQYDAKAILIPTFSNRLLNTPEKRREYFQTLAQREALNISLRERTLLVQPIAGSVHTISGIYNWRFMVEGELLNFEARFSYVLNLDSKTPILHHHSSQIPRTL